MLIFICILGAVIAGVIAAGKNRNPLGWAALGLFVPILGIVAVLCLAEVEAPAP